VPYPNYINTRVIRFGGATGQASGSLLCTRVVIKSSRSLVHDASGYRFEADTISNVSAAGGEVEFLLPTTDQAGMRDANTNALIDVSAPNTYTHQYTATITFELASGKPANSNTYTVGPFAFPQGDSSVVDGDKFIVTSTTAGQQISIPDSWSSRLTALETQVGSIPTTGFGDAAGKSVGNAAGTVAAGDDARFGTIPNSYVTDAKIAPTAAINSDKLADGTTNKVYTATEKTKLAGIATGATVNDTDANLENRTNHSGTEPLTALPISLATDLYQNNAGVWPSASAIESTRRVIWIGYPGLATAPATTGRPNSVAGLDTYIVRP